MTAAAPEPTAYTPTERELEIIRHTAAGLTIAATGRRMHLSPDAIKTCFRRLFRAAGATSQAQVIHWAWLNGHLGDRIKLIETNTLLINRVTNLTTMYRVAVARPGSERRHAAQQALERAEAEVRNARKALGQLEHQP